MHADNHLWLLGLLLVGTLRFHLLAVGIDGISAHLVGLDDRGSQNLVKPCGKTLSRSRVADNQG